jgi:hypothetical protein
MLEPGFPRHYDSEITNLSIWVPRSRFWGMGDYIIMRSWYERAQEQRES